MENIASNKINPSSLLLCQFESWCYKELSKVIIEQSAKNEFVPKFGCENGFSSFISLSLIIDCSLFVYEAIKLYEKFAPEEVEVIKKSAEYDDLKVIRRNIHTYNNRGSYKEKADTIIFEKLNEYEMAKPDIFYPLRNDISLIFQIENRTRYLLGSDYIFKHFIFETNNREWSGTHYHDYAAFIGSLVSGFSQALDETVFNLNPILCSNDEIRIELFDYKSADMFSRLDANHTIVFRILLILSQISYIILLQKQIIDKSTYQSDLWICFFTKLLAIKYDEAYDNLLNMYEYSNDKDNTFINNILNRTDVEDINVRKFAKSLRNTIHYQNIAINLNLIKDNTTYSWIRAIYLSNAGVNSIIDFRALREKLLNEINLLQEVLQKAFNLNKEY